MANNYKFLSGIAILILVISMGPALAAARKMTVIMVTGDVTYKRGAAKPRAIRKTTRLKPKDVVRTRVESSVEIRLDDGSVLKIEENSVINLAKLLKEGDVTNNKVVIKTGKVMFNVKKMASKRSDFVFETPTATAAIRGTIGGIGTNGKSTFAFLEEGGLELKPKGGGRAVLIKTLNVAIQKAKGFEVQAVVNNSALTQAVAVVERIFQDTSTQKVEIKLDSLINRIDSAAVQDTAKAPVVDSIKPDMGKTGAVDSAKIDTLASRADSATVKADTSAPSAPAIDSLKPDTAKTGVLDSTGKGMVSPPIDSSTAKGDSSGVPTSKNIAAKDTLPPEPAVRPDSADIIPDVSPAKAGDTLSGKTEPDTSLPAPQPVADTLTRAGEDEKKAKQASGPEPDSAMVPPLKNESMSEKKDSALSKTKPPEPGEDRDVSIEIQDTAALRQIHEEEKPEAGRPESIQMTLDVMTPADGAEIMEEVMIVSGASAPGASIKAKNISVAADASGQFAFQLKAPKKAGKYSLKVTAELNGRTLDKTVRFSVRPKTKDLSVSILSPVSGQTFLEGNDIAANGSVSPGASVSVNGKNANVTGDKWAALLTGLGPGEHNISVEAVLGEQSASAGAVFSVTQKKVLLTFSLISPKDGAEIKGTQIEVSGKGTPGAKVSVRGVSVAIGASGTWSLTIAAPKKPGEYNLQAEAVLDEQSITREAGFTVPEEELILEVKKPSDGDEISQSVIQVGGISTPGADIQVFEGRTRADASGAWSTSVQAPSKEGEYTMTVNAAYGSQTLSKEISIVRVIPKQPLKGAVNPVPSAINKPEITLSGSCNDGATIEAGNFSTQSKGGVWSMKVSWPEEEEGAIRFEVFCLFNDEEAVIGEVELEYTRPRIPLAVNMSTPAAVNLKSNTLNIRGDVKGRGVKVEVDGRGVALSSNRFNHIMKFSQQNWDVTEVEVVVSDGMDEISKTIEIEIDKTSPQINTNRPVFVNGPAIFNDQAIRYGVKDDPGDEMEVTLYLDNDDVEQFNYDGSVTGKTFDLVAGIHDYKIEVKDLAGNKSVWERRNISYWPRVEWSIEVVSPKSDRERYIPPPPPNADLQPRTDVQIRIKSLPDDDYRYLKEVRIKNEANQAERIWRDIEIDDIEFEFEDMPLVQRQVNLITIQVEPKKGPIRRATRKYTLR